MTWINGPNGVQDRLNTDRFGWEKDFIDSSLAPTAAPSTTAQPTTVRATQIPTAPKADATVVVGSTPREGIERAQLKLSDMPPGYRTISYGWANETSMVGQYDGTSLLSAPTVSSDLYLRASSEEVQAYVAGLSDSMPAGYDWLPSSLLARR